LSNTKLEHPYPYRVALLVTTFFGLIILLLNTTSKQQPNPCGEILLIILGGFSGSFIAANQDMHWWENNAPPSAQVEAEVLKAHQEHMDPTTRPAIIKRLFDIFFAAFGLVLSLPIWLLVTVLIWWEDPGPILFVKNAVSRGGKNFRQLKFRSMVLHAEKDSGPIPITSYENDNRVLSFGKFLRKTALDETPQLINILLGNMSAVGPRPQRTVLVHEYLKEMPEYVNRHCVRPGLAGLAQVVDSYDISPKEKLVWDFEYIQKANLLLDLKLLFSAFYLVFALRWSRDPHPEIRIRKILNVVKPEINPPQ
jgi:lipopolysaccharide/colanic/teichoic acid biosynthesis glycosyltransferase